MPRQAKPSQTVSRICFVFCIAAVATAGAGGGGADIALCCYFFLLLARILFHLHLENSEKVFEKCVFFVLFFVLLFSSNSSSSNSVIFVLLGGYILSFAVDNSLSVELTKAKW